MTSDVMMHSQPLTDSIANGILLDCDTEFIHFSENFDALIDADHETFASLENYQPTVIHKEFAAQIDRLKSANDPDDLLQSTADDLIQQSYLLTGQPSTREEIIHVNEGVDDGQDECLNNGIKIKEILKITGTFDAELFNKKFDEDSLKLTNQADEVESTDEGIDISSIYDLELPVSENSVKKMLDSRTKTERPISSWFLRQLLNSSNKGDTEESGDDETALRALALRKSLPTHHVFITYEDHRDTDEAAMDNVESQSGTTINSQSIKSLHIDMNVVDELSSMEDNIIDKDVDSPRSPRNLRSSSSSDSGLPSPSPGCSPSQGGDHQQESLTCHQTQSLKWPVATSGGPCVVTVTMPADVNAHLDAKKVSSKVDRKALRMIRNREAASNSRKKKREYMSTLEKQIADLSKIANTLKEENEKLKAMFFDM